MFLTRTGKKSELSDKDLKTCWPETNFISRSRAGNTSIDAWTINFGLILNVSSLILTTILKRT